MANEAQFNTGVHNALNADDPTRLFPFLPSVGIHLALPYPEPPESPSATTTTSPSQPLTPRALQILRNILETAVQKAAIRTAPHLLTAYSARRATATADPPSLATSTHLLAALSLPPKSPLALAFLQLLHAHCPALVHHPTLQQPDRRNVMPHDGGTLLCYAAMERRADVVAWLVREEGEEVAREARFWGKGVGEWVCAGLDLGDGGEGEEGEDVDVDVDAGGNVVEGEVAASESLAEVRRPPLGPRDGVGMFDRGVARVLLAAGVEFGEYEALVERLVGMGEEEWRAWVKKRRAAVARDERWEGDKGRRNQSGMRPLEREREVIDWEGWTRKGEFKWFVSTASREKEIWKSEAEDDDDVPLAVLVARWRSVRDQWPKATSGIADARNASGADGKGDSGAEAKDNRGATAKGDNLPEYKGDGAKDNNWAAAEDANLPVYKGAYGAHLRDSERPARGG